MHIVVYAHPPWFDSTSQQHFADTLCGGLRQRGHVVELRQPRPRLYAVTQAVMHAVTLAMTLAMTRAGLPWRSPPALLKWAGYVDQHLLFAATLRWARRHDPAHTLYVFSDQALGPWVPGFAGLPHVVHCHDLLALTGALGEGPGPPLRWSGRLYQQWIRRGFARARHFIAVSAHTRSELQRLAGIPAHACAVVHNGLNAPYRRLPAAHARAVLQAAGLGAAPEHGLLLHVGNGLWYKNPQGVLALYSRYARDCDSAGRTPLPLWMRSPVPDAALQRALQALPASAQVRFVPVLAPDSMAALYSAAELLLFPSHAEGFGWPIAEAMACGCAVVTTARAPMTEVGGPLAHYLPPCPDAGDQQALGRWAARGAEAVHTLLARDASAREHDAAAMVAWAQRFEPGLAIDAVLEVYRQVLAQRLDNVEARQAT